MGSSQTRSRRCQKGGVNVAKAFGEDFGVVMMFQQENELELPFDLVQLLSGGG